MSRVSVHIVVQFCHCWDPTVMSNAITATKHLVQKVKRPVLHGHTSQCSTNQRNLIVQETQKSDIQETYLFIAKSIDSSNSSFFGSTNISFRSNARLEGSFIAFPF